MPDQEEQIVERIRELLDRVLVFRDRVEAINKLGDPEPGSRGRPDANSATCREAWEYAALSAAVAVDHLYTWGKVHIEQGIQPWYAHLSLLRAALEGGVLVRWLMDPSLTDVERLARGMATAIDDQRERDKFERAVRGGKGAQKRMGSAKSGARRAEIRERARRRWGVGVAEVNATDQCDAYIASDAAMRGGAFYRLLGAGSHGKRWAALPTGKLEAAVDRAFGGKTVKMTTNDLLALYATAVVVVTVSLAIDELEAYSLASKT